MYWLSAGVFAAALVAVSIHNALSYPIYGGYDEAQHQRYADLLIHHGRIPSLRDNSEATQAPGFYAVTGVAEVVAAHLGAAQPWQVARGLNVVWLLASAALLLLTARLLWRERPRLQLAALGFFAFLPVVFKTGAMLHPEPLSMALSSAALYLAARLLVSGDLRVRAWLGLGLLLGLGQLVRAFSLWTFGAVLLALLARGLRRAVLAAAVAVVAGAALVAGPSYVRQQVRYGTPLPFNRPTPSTPLFRRRPASFYTALGLPQVLSHPVRPNFTNDALPTVYSELWGDYFGSFAWNGTPSKATLRQLTLQNELGLLPTALALAGWVALLVAATRRRDPPRLLVPLLPLVGLLGFLYFAVAHPSADGDVLKATYMLTLAPTWALCFGCAVDFLTRDRWVGSALLLVLAGSALFDLGFVVFQSPLEGVF